MTGRNFPVIADLSFINVVAFSAQGFPARRPVK
jgi:hypothetical protein